MSRGWWRRRLQSFSLVVPPGRQSKPKAEQKRHPSLRREDVTQLAKGDFFVSKLIVFSIAFCEKNNKVTACQDDDARLLVMTGKERGQSGAAACRARVVK
jgi:hypothetical protein